MVKKVIIGIVSFFVIMTALTFFIFNSVDDNIAENKTRTEADFVSRKYIINELWENQTKKGENLISSYLFIKVENSPVNLRLPIAGNPEDIAKQLKKGDSIEVKVIAKQLGEAEKNGAIKAVTRFIMGDNREVTVYKLSAHNKVLVDKDINDWDEAKVSLLKRVTDQPFILIIPFAIIIGIIGRMKRRKLALKNK